MRAGRNLLVALGAFALVGSAGGAPARAGSVMGTVRIQGPPPARPKLPVYKNREVCGEGIGDERLVLGPNGGVRYAVVTVEGVPGGARVEPETDVLLDNRDCRFVPHVQTAQVGQRVELSNSDPILHNADARLGDRTLFNVALTPGRRIRKALEGAGIVHVTCDVRHTWMKAYIVVVGHPFSAVTDVYGDYDIREIPPGTYTVRVWHEELGTQQHPVTIEGDKPTQLDVTFPAPAPAKVPE